MTPHRSTRPVPSARARRWMTITPPALLVLLAFLVVLRVADGGRDARPDDETSRARASDTAPAATSYEPATVAVPAGWTRVGRRDGVTTWRDADSGDAVSVAAVEAAAAPLAAIVADVARRAATAPATTVRTPRQIAARDANPRDVVMVLDLQTRVEGRELYVRQVWKRDRRAGRDVVATWTSSDQTWAVDPETTVPALDLR